MLQQYLITLSVEWQSQQVIRIYYRKPDICKTTSRTQDHESVVSFFLLSKNDTTIFDDFIRGVAVAASNSYLLSKTRYLRNNKQNAGP
jgi:hypothetical protein